MGEEEKSYSHERKPKFLEVNENRRKTTGCASVGLDGPTQLGRLSFFFLLSLFSFITFTFVIQIDSIQFVKFPRIQHINLEL
jgi:hypothetical protein